MSWRDGLPPDKLLTDVQIDQMGWVACLVPNLKFDFHRRSDPPTEKSQAFNEVTLQRVIVHHETLVAEIERLRALLDLRMTEFERRMDVAEMKAADLISQFESELHAGHTLVPQSYYTAPNVRPGWMICIRCKYETPMIGRCDEHETLDKCWAAKLESQKVTPKPKPCEPPKHRWLCPDGVLPKNGDPCQCGEDRWCWPVVEAPPSVPDADVDADVGPTKPFGFGFTDFRDRASSEKPCTDPGGHVFEQRVRQKLLSNPPQSVWTCIHCHQVRHTTDSVPEPQRMRDPK